MKKLALESLLEVFDKCIDFWHIEPDIREVPSVKVNSLALELAWRNCLLWHEEDKARRTDVDDSTIAVVKRAIDRLNQQRNDLIEKLDEVILAEVERITVDLPEEIINCETPGSIVDRLSILSLKIYHMDEDSRRSDVSDEHRRHSHHRLDVLRLQRHDLYVALDRLLDDYLAGRKRMKLYKQFKMYNDPTLNPELYSRKNILKKC